MARNLKVNEGSGGVEQITMAGAAASQAGADQECTEVIVYNTNAATAHLNIGAAATANHFPLVQNVPITVAVLNTNQVNVLAGNAEKIEFLWRK